MPISLKIIQALLILASTLALVACDERISLSAANNDLSNGSGSESSAGITVTSSSAGNSLSFSPPLDLNSLNGLDTSSVADSEDVACPASRVATPRGLSCLHCLHDNAAQQSREIIRILASSCLENVAVSYLVDGSFGTRWGRIIEHVRILRAAGKRPFVHLYLLNGPSQRQWRTTPVRGLFTRLSPESFRRRVIGSDVSVQAKLNTYIEAFTPTLRALEKLGAIISLVPMLEDNLDEESFNALAEIILDSLPPDLAVSVGRNACVGCYSKNDGTTPAGYYEEHHGKNVGTIPTDGVFSNDGIDVSFNGQGLGSGVISLSAARELRDRATENNTVFLLWNAEYQGLQSTSGRIRGTGISPNSRHYATPTRSETIQLIRFLNGK